MNETYLSIKDVTKKYKKEKAVDGISLDVERGKFITILGPSGSGKTTLLKLIAGFEDLNGGSILLDNEDISNKMPYQREIGMVFQNYALFPHMTVSQNVAYPLRIRKMNKDEIKQKTKEIMELVNLTGFEDRNSKLLSGGQQQRVALARAIVYNPPLLLLDEPLGALDKNLREKMQFEIRRIQKETGITTISVTHDQEEALTMSDLICIMNNGKIEQVDTPEEIYLHPQNKFVAEFIGEVNLLTGNIVKQENGLITVKLEEDPEKVFYINETRNLSGDENKVHLVLRPENMHVVTKEHQYENNLEVTVLEKVFVGEAIKVKVKTTFNQEISLKVPFQLNDKLQLDHDITLGWDTSDSSLIAYEE